jgi:hypothetical protein
MKAKVKRINVFLAEETGVCDRYQRKTAQRSNKHPKAEVNRHSWRQSKEFMLANEQHSC